MTALGSSSCRIMQRLMLSTTSLVSSHIKIYPRVLINHQNVPLSCRLLSTTSLRKFADASGGGGKEGENKITKVLQKAFPSASKLRVEDISGGCGSMYQVLVEAKEFEGLSIVKQHQLVNKALKEEIKDMHGIRIQTQPSK